MKIKKLHENAVLPSKANKSDAGFDLTAVSIEVNTEHGYIEYDTGLAIQVPRDSVGLLFARSSISKTSLILANSVGVLDRDYTGPVKLRFKTSGDGPKYEVGDRIGQLVVMDLLFVEPVFVDELDETDRGDGGFGSSGK